MVGSDSGGSPVHIGHSGVHDLVDEGGVHAALVEHELEGRGGDGTELGSADTLHTADEGGIVVFAADQHFGGFAHADDIGTGHDVGGTAFIHSGHNSLL